MGKILNSIKLSILICSIERRKNLLSRLLNELEKQKSDSVEILVDIDNGLKSIGLKRNNLLKKSKGEYVSFIDDDDLVSSSYVDDILKAIENKPDCIGIEGIITVDGKNPRVFIHSLKYKSWFENKGIYYRNPNHLNPVKRQIALKALFPDKNSHEDREYSKRIFPLLKSEEYIKKPIYFYLYKSKK